MQRLPEFVSLEYQYTWSLMIVRVLLDDNRRVYAGNQRLHENSISCQLSHSVP
jgi:hypothetical protein